MSKAIKKQKTDQNHSRLIETDSDVKSYIYQMVSDFSNYVTPNTMIQVIARNPKEPSKHENYVELMTFNFRIAIVLEEDGASIESEAFHDNIYEAIKLAKVSLIDRLAELQDKIEASKDAAAEEAALESARSVPKHQLH